MKIGLGGGPAMKEVMKGTGAHKTLWEITGTGHHHHGGSQHLKSVMELGWAAQKVHAAEAFTKMHAHKYKRLDIHQIIKLK